MFHRAARDVDRAVDVARSRQRLYPGKPRCSERRIDPDGFLILAPPPRLDRSFLYPFAKGFCAGSSRFDRAVIDVSIGPSICSLSTILWLAESSTSTVSRSALVDCR